MTQPLPAESTVAHKKRFVTYTVPTASLDAKQITLLESPSLLASSGTTGFRTWEAALFLGTYLTSPFDSALVAGKNVIELGAGTGFLSILCAKHLRARHVLATDGSREVVNDMALNLSLNALSQCDHIQVGQLQWGHPLIDGVADRRRVGHAYDLVIGADVTYDVNSIPSLIATLHDLSKLYPRIKILISATIRNEDTLGFFFEACLEKDLNIKRLEIPMIPRDEQLGFFVPTSTSIHVFSITYNGATGDHFPQ